MNALTLMPIDWAGPKRQPCSVCGRGPKDRTCGVTLDERGGVAHCHRCGYVETHYTDRPMQRPGGPVARTTAPTRHDTLSDFGLALWATCQPLGGEALAYLRARACMIPPTDGHLRWHPALKHPPSGMKGPALVALITSALTRQPLTLHRTWISADGSKAPVDPPRMLLGGHRKAGGVVRLWPDEMVSTGLGVAEGVETALALAHAITPVWACIDSGNLGKLPALRGIEALTIAVDNDAAGIKAARACADRWSLAGAEVRVVMPAGTGSDMNDVSRLAA